MVRVSRVCEGGVGSITLGRPKYLRPTAHGSQNAEVYRSLALRSVREERFFRTSTALPLILPLLGGLALLPLDSIGRYPPWLNAITEIVGSLAIFGAYGAIPYILFLIVLFAFIRPKTVEAWRATFGTAPLLIAVALVLVMTAVATLKGYPFFDAANGSLLFGMFAFITGYAYAGIICVRRSILRLTGYIRPT